MQVYAHVITDFGVGTVASHLMVSGMKQLVGLVLDFTLLIA